MHKSMVCFQSSHYIYARPNRHTVEEDGQDCSNTVFTVEQKLIVVFSLGAEHTAATRTLLEFCCPFIDVNRVLTQL